MADNPEEKRKCQEKLNEMEKFLPFLDFMIDKIKKKSTEIPLECQLGKFQNLRSLIREKGCTHSWDSIAKVEEVIKKLMTKLDYKEEDAGNLVNSTTTTKKNSLSKKASDFPDGNMTCRISSGTTTTISVTSASSLCHTTTVMSRPQDSLTHTFGLSVKTPKISVDGGPQKNAEDKKDVATRSAGCKQSSENSVKMEISRTIETDLDKDLDGFELTDVVSNLSETNSKSTTESSKKEEPSKLTFHTDLLSSSREKLLKSLQKKLAPVANDRPSSQLSAVYNREKMSDSNSISAFSSGSSRVNCSESWNKSGFSVGVTNSEKNTNSLLDRPVGGNANSTEKAHFNSVLLSPTNEGSPKEGNNQVDPHSKQMLREKLSADICEVYKVPGKSVGGSLRLLKEGKDNKKLCPVEEDELFKPDRITEINRSASSSSTEGKHKGKDKHFGNRSKGKRENAENENKDGKCNKKESPSDDKTPGTKKGCWSHPGHGKSESHSNGKTYGTAIFKGDSRKGNDAYSNASSFDDSEVAEAVNKDMMLNPHPPKPAPFNLNKYLKSKDSVNGDKVQDKNVDELTNDVNKPKLQTVVPEKIKFYSRESDDLNSTSDCPVDILRCGQSQVSSEESRTGTTSINEDFNESDYAQKLIEETTPNKPCVKKVKSLLDLPFPKVNDVEVPTSNKPRTKKIKSSLSLPSPKVNYKVPTSVRPETCKPGPAVSRDPRLKAAKERSNAYGWPPSSNCHNSVSTTDTLQTGRFDFTSQNIPRNSHSSRTGRNTNPLLDGLQNLANVITYKLCPIDMGNTKYQGNPLGSVNISSGSPLSNIELPKAASNVFQVAKSYADYMKMKQRTLGEKASQLTKSNRIRQNSWKKKEKKNIGSLVVAVPPASGSPNLQCKKTDSVAGEDGTNVSSKIKVKTRKKKKKNKIENANATTQSTSLCNSKGIDEQKNVGGVPGANKSLTNAHLKADDPKTQKSGSAEVKKNDDDSAKKCAAGIAGVLVENEETISPLDNLYERERLNATGRGYGLQNFKIPKKGQSASKQVTNVKEGSTRGPQSEPSKVKPQQKTSDNIKTVLNNVTSVKNAGADHTNRGVSGTSEKVQNERRLSDEAVGEKSEKNFPVSVESKTAAATETTKTDPLVPVECSISDRQIDTTPVASAVSSRRTSSQQQNSEKERTELEDKSKDTKEESSNDVEVPEVLELSSQSSDKSQETKETESVKSVSENKAVVNKEEITKEFVEALIRKSFQSGEGKLLLAQTMLFEEFARKLNSKKLKTIQKIINSESDSDSSSDSFSDESRRRKRRRKSSERSVRSRKKKRKLRRVRKLISSSSESDEESSEDEGTGRREGMRKDKENSVEKSNADRELGKAREGQKTLGVGSDTTKQESTSAVTVQTEEESEAKENARNINSCISKRKDRRKRGRKKLLEQILKQDEEQSEGVAGDKTPRTDPDNEEKELEQRSKPRGRGRMTELDRLHDDIRSMFISSGVVTATGLRMCRMLKASGGSMNNLDIVKESAKMVEEEKLKSGQVRRYSRQSRSRQIRGRRGASASDSSDFPSSSCDRSKSSSRCDSHANIEESATDCSNTPNEIPSKGPLVLAENIKKQPCVILHKLDMKNFNIGKKVSEYCGSLGRERGRSIAAPLEGNPKATKGNENNKNKAGGVFLTRNIRKYSRLEGIKSKKPSTRRSLVEVIKNLPLKMAKMKHLEIYDKKMEMTNEAEASPSKKQRNTAKKKTNAMGPSTMAAARLLNYAFEKRKVMYPCKLCLHITRNITWHYKTVHPDSEVLISRLSKVEAQKAISECGDDDLAGSTTFEQSTSLEMIKKRVKSKLKGTIAYYCRFCSCAKITDTNAFFVHVSGHTGEYRFKCPSENCSLTAPTRENLKFHILSKHPDNRLDLYNKIIELFKVPVQGGNIYGYLCSKCHYVQMSQENVERHVHNNHMPEEEVAILRIDMSGKRPKEEKEEKTGRGKKKKGSKQVPDDSEGVDSEEVKTDEVGDEDAQGSENMVQKVVLHYEARKRKMKDDNGDNAKPTATAPTPESRGQEVDGTTAKKSRTEDPEKKEGSSKSDDDSCDPIELLDVEDVACPDEEDAENLVGSDSNRVNVKEDPQANQEDNQVPEEKVDVSRLVKALLEDSSCETQEQPVRKLKVGPLEAQVLGGSIDLYECYVKGCLFSTKVFDLFEKHVKISHAKTKWNGVCDICWGKEGYQVHLTSYKLIYALNHLKHHEKDFVTDNINLELLLNKTPGVTRVSSDSVESSKSGQEGDSITVTAASEATESSFPRVPLLRVRNLLGDRLSKPKENSTEDDAGKPAEQESEKNVKAGVEPVMFTIENVRSLNTKDVEDSSDVQIEEIVPLVQSSKTSDVLKDGKALTSGKPVLIRSCPGRKITIRSDTTPVEVGHLKVVKAASVTPVVLSPLSNVTPIRILSSVTSPPSTPKFSVQPVMVSATPPFLQKTKKLSVIVPVSSPTLTTSSSSAVTTSVETMSTQQTSLSQSGEERTELYVANPLDTLFGGPSKGSKSPSKVPRAKSSRPDVPPEGTTSSSELDGEDTPKRLSVLQRIPNAGIGNKSVKDAKVYQQMLTKSKLCHLFKCMAIECSFTCNSENVFTQHIGLHEAQRRMKHKKLWKNLGIDSNHKLRKVFHWYQCSYCCEVLANTSFALSRHIIVEHGHCTYQCAYCFYRAVSQSYVEIHQNLVHQQILKNNSRVIYKCQPLSRTPPASVALEKHGRRQSVRPYHCEQCGSKFYITQEFLDHLTAEHQSVTAYTCHICKNLHFKADRLIVHYKLHSYCTYQCAYCLQGTDTETEMIFHLCNFHFSQPAYMYVRALAENQSDVGLKKKCKKKKSCGTQIEALKVIRYENEPLNTDCIVEADPEEEKTDNSTENVDSLDISAIVAELGINTEQGPGGDVSPLMRELASMGGDNVKDISVKRLLPNAQFSSESETPEENFSLLLASGTNSKPSEVNENEDMPLGQLNLEVVTNKTVQLTTSSVSSVSNSLKPNEIIINFNRVETPLHAVAEESGVRSGDVTSVVSTAFHKLPPVVLSRKTCPKNVYPPKNSSNLDKKTDVLSCEREEQSEARSEANLKNELKSNALAEMANSKETHKTEMTSNKGNVQPRITGVISLAGTEVTINLPKITEVCSLSAKESEQTALTTRTDLNKQILQPPIIRVEDFNIDEEIPKSLPKPKDGTKSSGDEEKDDSDASPDVIILEEGKKKTDDVVTVTIDSEDEKDVETDKMAASEGNLIGKNEEQQPDADNVIRKEMEKLRNQIANETDCLLFDDPEPNLRTPLSDEGLTIKPDETSEVKSGGLLSPIEEAICSLNKKLEEEGEKLRREKSIEEEEEEEEETKKAEDASTQRNIPRTRSFVKEKALRQGKTTENLERSDSEDSNTAHSGSGTWESPKKEGKKFSGELTGKNLYICGNIKCNFAAKEDIELKDHLYICDLSRESTALTCPHCFKTIKQFNTYIEHLKHHGEKKFSCGLCSFSSAVETSAMRHVRQKHKCELLKTVPKDPPKEGYFVIYPKAYKIDKVDFELNGYSPGDEDKLPLQAVYQVNVKCAQCPYFTKVRSNMVRHLKIHAKSAETEGVVVVPSTAPTNPVPCLDTKERMFDKMTNLAASSQLAQAKEKTAIEALAPEDEAKMPQFVAEQLRYKCCLPDCNYITVDDCMLRHHIKALHDEISYYSCPHCPSTVHLDSRNVALDKIGYHLKHHDAKLYKCPYCLHFHYQKVVVEKHTLEKHPERRYYVHTVREPKGDTQVVEEPQPAPESCPKIWKCGLCKDYQNASRLAVMEHLGKVHNTKSKFKCRLCEMKSNHCNSFSGHYASKHPGEKVSYVRTLFQENGTDGNPTQTASESGSSDHFDTTPLWQRGAPRVRHIRGILIEEEEVKTKKCKRSGEETEPEAEVVDTAVAAAAAHGNSFYCPLCSEKKKFQTKSADCLRSHLYQELNYQQFACILCGKMFVDKKDYERHHAKSHPDKEQSLKQTKEDGEIMLWVDKVIAKQREEMERKKRRLSEEDSNDSQGPLVKKKRKCD